ncbi:winged helix-turn-helix transcriptional regulator [candidate division KSB1 bacterium]|nr:winged helix-turn-helix transcriptional regulator [candidate division KSB1 bacterium]
MNSSAKIAELAPQIMGAFHDLGEQHPKGERLSMRQYQALIVLNADDRLTLKQFCEKLSLAPSTGTELANRMIDLGYFYKESESEDRRHALLTVTPKGKALLKQRQLALTKMFDVFLEPFEQNDRQTFVHAFERIWELIEKYHIQPKKNQ